jgi:hypothetical protein
MGVREEDIKVGTILDWGGMGGFTFKILSINDSVGTCSLFNLTEGRPARGDYPITHFNTFSHNWELRFVCEPRRRITKHSLV